jgi:hypothetical protein
MPKIYCFSNAADGGVGVAYAMAEDGNVLGSRYCSNQHYVPQDLGMLYGLHEDRKAAYRKHYPEGYEMEFVPSAEVLKHPGLMEAFRLNQLIKEADDA